MVVTVYKAQILLILYKEGMSRPQLTPAYVSDLPAT